MKQKVGAPALRPIPPPSRLPREGVRQGRRAHRGLRDAAHRRERALRRGTPDSVDRLDRAVPRERARVPAGPAAKGAHPVLLVNKSPYAGAATPSRGGARWRRSPTSSARSTCRRRRSGRSGRSAATGLLRQSYRNAVADLTSIGIPANRLGIMLSFLSQRASAAATDSSPPRPGTRSSSGRRSRRSRSQGSSGSARSSPGAGQSGTTRRWTRQAEGGLRLALGTAADALQRAPEARRRFDRSLTAGQIRSPHGTVCRAEGLGAVGAERSARSRR